MRRAQLKRMVADSAVLLTSTGRQLDCLLDKLDQYSGGYAASASGTGERVRGAGSELTSVEAAAARPDEAIMARMEVEERVALLHGELTRLHRLIAAWTVPRGQGKGVAGQAGCEWCSSFPGHLTNANGCLPERTRLCDWCRRWLVTTGVKPSRAATVAHLAGFRPKKSARMLRNATIPM